MNKYQQKYKNDVSFIDLLFNTLLLAFFMFVIAFLLINLPNSKKIDSKAELLVIMEWPNESFDDIDLWMSLPSGKKVGFPNKHVDLVHLERDDRGLLNDSYVSNGQVILVKENIEVMSVRGLAPGEYVVNIHVFKDNRSDGTEDNKINLPYDVNVKLIKINPTYQELAFVKVRLEKQGQEETAFAFEITSTGYVRVMHDVEEKFVYKTFVERYNIQQYQSHP